MSAVRKMLFATGRGFRVAIGAITPATRPAFPDRRLEKITKRKEQFLPQRHLVSMGNGGLLPYVYFTADWICE